MKFLQISYAVLALASCSADNSGECPEKETECETRLAVDVSSLVEGFMDGMPQEVFTKFVEASSLCLKCVDKSNLKKTRGGDDDSGGGSGNNGCNIDRDCRECGTQKEMKNNCKACCPGPRCMGCDWNLGPLYNNKGKDIRRCSNRCNPEEYTYPYSLPTSVLSIEEVVEATAGEIEEADRVEFKLDVCMAEVDEDTDYTTMVDRFKDELNACYAAKDTFMDSWSSLCVDVGIDLPNLMKDNNRESIMLSLDELDAEDAVVTTYSSDETHRSSSHMLFYSALGFVTVAAFAVFGTAVVVRVLNKRQEDRDTQAAQWVSELTSTETTNPVSASQQA
jgi:hypothetical protein